MEYREIIQKGDLVIFNKDLLKPLIQTHYNELIKKDYSFIPRCKWIPERNEPFIVKKSREHRFRENNEYRYELWVDVYSEKGAWTSRGFPAKFLQWIIQMEDGKPNKRIFISEVFNSDLFVAIGEEAEWKWLAYQNYIKD